MTVSSCENHPSQGRVDLFLQQQAAREAAALWPRISNEFSLRDEEGGGGRGGCLIKDKWPEVLMNKTEREQCRTGCL